MKSVISLFICLHVFSLFSCNNTATAPVQVRINESIVDIEIADTDKTRSVGLMFRKTLASNAGMLFVFEKPLIPSFYMKNTAIPLDILFIDKDFKIVTIKKMYPFEANVYHSPVRPSLYALEVNQGWCEKHAVEEGMKVKFLGKR